MRAALVVPAMVGLWLAVRWGEIERDGVMNTAVNDLASIPGLDGVRVSNMGRVSLEMVDHPNVQAMLRVIRQGESGQGADAYRMIVGGGYFDGWADHPRIKGRCWKTATGKTLCSTAAGAYQITATSWDETKKAMGLGDFSPRSQDIAAVGRMAYRGALPAVIAGDFGRAVGMLVNEWTSLPGGAEPNQAQSAQIASGVYLAWGGTMTNGVTV